MHPSMLYEIRFNLVAIAVIVRFRDRVPVVGDTFKFYLLAAAIFRFLVEFVRGNEPQALGLTGPQWVLIPLGGLLALHLVRRRRAGDYRVPAPPPVLAEARAMSAAARSLRNRSAHPTPRWSGRTTESCA